MKKYVEFINEVREAYLPSNLVVQNYSITDFIGKYKIDIKKYANQEEPLKDKLIAIIYGDENIHHDHFNNLIHAMAGELDDESKIAVLTPYSDFFEKDEYGNILEIGGQIGKWKKFDINKDVIVDLEAYSIQILNQLVGSYVNFTPAWWSYDVGPFPDEGLTIKLESIKHISDAIVFIDENGEEFYPSLLDNITRRKGPKMSVITAEDPYGEEDWEDSSESKMKSNMLEDIIDESINEAFIYEAKGYTLIDIGSTPQWLMREFDWNAAITSKFLRDKLVGNRVSFYIQDKNWNTVRKLLLCKDIFVEDKNGNYSYHFIDGKNRDWVMLHNSDIKYQKKPNRMIDPIKDPYGEEDWDN